MIPIHCRFFHPSASTRYVTNFPIHLQHYGFTIPEGTQVETVNLSYLTTLPNGNWERMIRIAFVLPEFNNVRHTITVPTYLIDPHLANMLAIASKCPEEETYNYVHRLL